jgi:membrane fusion protein (multidrug efflux system)
VPENYTGKVHVGSDVALIFPEMQKTITTKINVIGKVIDPLSRSFFIETKLAPNNDFRPNQIVQVKIKDYSKTNALSIPINILQNDEKGKFIYVAVNENGKLVARKKIITVGEFYGDNMEVLTGLAVGDAIITTGYQNLFDGQFITTVAK